MIDSGWSTRGFGARCRTSSPGLQAGVVDTELSSPLGQDLTWWAALEVLATLYLLLHSSGLFQNLVSQVARAFILAMCHQ